MVLAQVLGIKYTLTYLYFCYAYLCIDKYVVYIQSIIIDYVLCNNNKHLTTGKSHFRNICQKGLNILIIIVIFQMHHYKYKLFCE